MNPENKLSQEAKHEINKIKEIPKTVKIENLICRTNEYRYLVEIFLVEIFLTVQLLKKKLLKIKVVY